MACSSFLSVQAQGGRSASCSEIDDELGQTVIPE
jgi:hypothetical protein